MDGVGPMPAVDGDGGVAGDPEDDGERIIGLDETTTAGEPVQLDDGTWVDRITGGPLVVLRPGAWDRSTCTTDPCRSRPID